MVFQARCLVFLMLNVNPIRVNDVLGPRGKSCEGTNMYVPFDPLAIANKGTAVNQHLIINKLSMLCCNSIKVIPSNSSPHACSLVGLLLR